MILVIVPCLILLGLYLRNHTTQTQPLVKPNLLLIGDSIGYGVRDCTDVSCDLEANTFLALYASYHGLPRYINASESETSAFEPDNLIKESTSTSAKKMSGVARARAGEFAKYHDADVIIEYGRNDVNAGVASDSNFYNALLEIGNSLLSPGGDNVARNNSLVYMTIPPMTPTSWISAASKRTARPEYKEQIASTEYPIEYDSIFSARIWEAAQELGADIVPVHEYLYFHPDEKYFSTDGIHPSSEGVKLLTWLFTFRGGVIKTDLNSIPLNSTISVTSNEHGFGMVVSKKDGQIIQAKPLELIEGNRYPILRINDEMTLLSTVPISAIQ